MKFELLIFMLLVLKYCVKNTKIWLDVRVFVFVQKLSDIAFNTIYLLNARHGVLGTNHVRKSVYLYF